MCHLVKSIFLVVEYFISNATFHAHFVRYIHFIGSPLILFLVSGKFFRSDNLRVRIDI